MVKRASAFKAPYGKRRRYSRPKYRKYRPMSSAPRFRRARFAKAVMRAVNRNAEVKEVMRDIANNNTLQHNRLTNLNNNVFYSDIGVNGGNPDDYAQRIGNKIFCKGIKIAIMIENQQYRPQCNYWLYCVRLKSGRMDDTINAQSDMFEGISTTVPMDYLDTAKCDVLWAKKFTVRAPNAGTSLPMGGTVDGAANAESAGADYTVYTNGQKIIKTYMPVNKTILYRDTADAIARRIPASFRYQWVMVAYDNFSTTTGGTTYPVGHVTITTIMKFTDV